MSRLYGFLINATTKCSHGSVHLMLVHLGARLLNPIPGPHRRLFGLIITCLFEMLEHFADPWGLEKYSNLALHAAGQVAKQACYCTEVGLKENTGVS